MFRNFHSKLHFIINFIHILFFCFVFLLVGILRISDALYICGSCTNGTITFSSRMDCYCLYFYLPSFASSLLPSFHDLPFVLNNLAFEDLDCLLQVFYLAIEWHFIPLLRKFEEKSHFLQLYRSLSVAYCIKNKKWWKRTEPWQAGS